MKRNRRILTIFLICAMMLAACGSTEPAVITQGTKRNPASKTTAVPTVVPTDVPTVVPTLTPTPTPTEVPFTPYQVDAARFNYTSEEVIAYYCEVGLNSEYNNSPKDFVRKWTSPILVVLEGIPDDDDIALMERLFLYLNSIEGFPGIAFASENEIGNFIIRILPYDSYQKYALPHVNGDATDGYSTIWHSSGRITQCEIGIQADLERSNKNHVILEEIVQSLGLQNDSYWYSESLFYQAFNTPQWLWDLDCLLVEFLYCPALKPGDSKEDVLRIGSEVIHGAE